MTSADGHVSRSYRTNTTPPWASSARYGSTDQRLIKRSSRAYEFVNHEQDRAASARAGLQEKLAKREVVQEKVKSQLTGLIFGLYAMGAVAPRGTK